MDIRTRDYPIDKSAPARASILPTIAGSDEIFGSDNTALEMPPHRFRHAVGKIYLDRNPGQYGVVQRLLGHKRIETTIAIYCGEEGVAAARHYHETILGLRHSVDEAEDADD